MKSIRIRERSWRFYQNWLIHFAMWGTLLLIALGAARRPFPWPVYLLLAYPVYIICSGIYYAYRVTHPGGRFAMRNVTPADAGMDFETVEFPSRDELTLFGWYVPSENGSIIILVHGHGGKGIAMIYHASALVAKGYGVLMYDQRAHGSSDGDVCTRGWLEAEDVLGALDYLQARSDVDPERIGVLGISLGGKAALLAAARDEGLRAVIAEGPGPLILADHGGRPTTLRRWINYPANLFYYRVLRFMNGVQPTEGILDTIAEIAPRPVMLIAAEKGSELTLTRVFYEAAAQPKEIWEVPKAKHAGAYFVNPQAYQEKIVGFFERALEH